LKKTLFLWFGILVSALFLYIALRDLDVQTFLTQLRHANLGDIFIGFVILLIVYGVRTLRWKAIIDTECHVSLWHTFAIQMIGFFGNNVFPARAGEIIRAFLLRRQIGVPRSFALGTIAVERVSDLSALIGLLLLSLFLIPADRLPAETGWIRLASGVVLVTFLSGAAVLVWARNWMGVVLHRVLTFVVSDRFATGIVSRFDAFAQGLTVLQRPGKLLLVMFYAVLDWVLMIGVFFSVFRGLNLDVPLVSALFSVALVHLGMLIPASPGYVGTYEFFLKKALGVFAVPGSVAVAVALVIRLLWYMFETVSGFVLLWTSQISVKELFRITTEAAPDAENEALDRPL